MVKSGTIMVELEARRGVRVAYGDGLEICQ